MAHDKPIEQCKTWDDFERYASHHGLEQKRTTGGHVIYGNERGSIPFSSHGHGELPKGVRHSLAKEILALIGVILFVVIPAIWMLS